MPRTFSRMLNASARDWRRRAAGLGVLLLVWVGVGVTIQVAKAQAPRADRVAAEAKRVAVLPSDADERAARLKDLAARVQRLSLDQRLDDELLASIESAVAEMTPDEQRTFVQDILPPGLAPMVAAFRAMDDTQKRLAIDRLRREFKHAGWVAEDTDRGTFSELVEASVQAFVEAEDPQAQLDLMPMMQQILRAMQTR